VGQKAIDLTEMGYVRISGKKGEIHFICVDGQMDIRKAGNNKFKFSWDGSDECDAASGFGDFTYKDDILIGRIYFHNGDDSSFRAKRIVS
jgi:hypothetical protein